MVKKPEKKDHMLYDFSMYHSDHWLSGDDFRGKSELKGGIIIFWKRW